MVTSGEVCVSMYVFKKKRKEDKKEEKFKAVDSNYVKCISDVD